MPSVLDRFLVTDRIRPRYAKGGIGMARPILLEHSFDNPPSSLLATNLCGDFVPTKLSSSGIARFAFFECTVRGETAVLRRLFKQISTRKRDVESAKKYMSDLGRTPSKLLVPSDLMDDFQDGYSDEEIRYLTASGKGVAKVYDLPAIVADIKSPVVISEPSSAGIYVRSGDYLGLLICNIESSFVVVDHALDG